MIDACRDKPANRSDHKVAIVVYDGFAPFDLVWSVRSSGRTPG